MPPNPSWGDVFWLIIGMFVIGFYAGALLIAMLQAAKQPAPTPPANHPPDPRVAAVAQWSKRKDYEVRSFPTSKPPRFPSDAALGPRRGRGRMTK